MREVGHYIQGEHRVGLSQRFGKIFNPTLGAVSGRVAFASTEEVHAAVVSAREAFLVWSEFSLSQRAQIFFRFKELLERNREQIAMLICDEEGKTLSEAHGEIRRGIEIVEFCCNIASTLKGEFSENIKSGSDVHSMRQPLGVCAGITPFNFPVMVPMWMFPIAIACGNTFILKPSERAPSPSILLAELFHKAGAPAGVLNVVHGDKETVNAILAHSDIKAISFVGSTQVAEHIHQTATKNHKRVQAMGGAKNHAIIMPDADIDYATDAIVSAAYGSAGERCMAISVVIAVGEIGDTCVEKLASRVNALTIGAPTSPEIKMGPLVNEELYTRVRDYISIGLEEGAQLVVDGRDQKPSKYKDGYFMGGSLFDKVEPSMRIYREEIFGPVLSVVRAGTYEEALALVNAHELGNGAAIFTANGATARDFSLRAKAGMIGINDAIPVPAAAYSFGGWKASLYGDHAVYGKEGVNFYTNLKTVTSHWPRSSQS